MWLSMNEKLHFNQYPQDIDLISTMHSGFEQDLPKKQVRMNMASSMIPVLSNKAAIKL